MAHPPQTFCFSIDWEVAPTKEAVLVNWTGVRSVLSRQFRKGWGNRPRVSAFSGSEYLWCWIHLVVSWQLNRQLNWTGSSCSCGGADGWRGHEAWCVAVNQGQLQPSNLWEPAVSGTSQGSLGTRQIHIVASWVEAAFRRARCKSPGRLVILPACTISITVSAIAAS